MPTATDVRAFFSQLWGFFKAYWVATAIALIFVIAVVGYVAGYRLSAGFTFVRVGTLEISSLPQDAQVFIDQGSRGLSQTGSMSILLVPGTHAVIVAESGMEPWETIATIKTGAVTAVEPILFPMHPTVAPLSPSDTAAALSALAAPRLPSASAPLVLGCASLSVDKNRIVADVASSTPGCTPPPYICSGGECAPTIVFSPIGAIRDVVAYPGRTDALLVAAGDTLYAIGLDPRTPQAFAQLLSAPNISIAALPGGSIVARNSTGVYGLKF